MADTLEQIVCPACGNVMEKVFIPSEGINLDICTEGCGGIFFDNKEFDAFNEADEDVSVVIEKLKNKQFSAVDDNKKRICPSCGAEMVKNPAGLKSSVIIDECYVCSAKFLDNGELMKIREEYQNDSDRSAETMAYVYHKVGRQLAKTNRDYAIRNINNKSSLGKKLFDALFGF